jgi:hypothetical protein
MMSARSPESHASRSYPPHYNVPSSARSCICTSICTLSIVASFPSPPRGISGTDPYISSAEIGPNRSRTDENIGSPASLKKSKSSEIKGTGSHSDKKTSCARRRVREILGLYRIRLTNGTGQPFHTCRDLGQVSIQLRNKRDAIPGTQTAYRDLPFLRRKSAHQGKPVGAFAEPCQLVQIHRLAPPSAKGSILIPPGAIIGHRKPGIRQV